MYLTLKKEATKPAAKNLLQQQAKLVQRVGAVTGRYAIGRDRVGGSQLLLGAACSESGFHALWLRGQTTLKPLKLVAGA